MMGKGIVERENEGRSEYRGDRRMVLVFRAVLLVQKTKNNV